ncbi:MAG: hypothetical protein U0169_24970, partial [Polyangiaceae bacterium]
MKLRRAVIALLVLPASASAFVACSSSGGGGFDGDDAGSSLDATTPSVDGNVVANSDATTGPDARDGATTVRPDAGGQDAADGGTASDAARTPEGGRCSRVNGPECDIVLQDCPRTSAGGAQECVAASSPNGGGPTTTCIPVTANKVVPRGQACCVGAGGDPCVAGTECIGGDRCTDGGPKLGRCSPRCCPDDDGVCGADDDGIPGHCNLGIVEEVGGSPLYHVCTYERVCVPFGVRPCGTGRTCLVRDQAGTTSCSDIFDPDGGTGAGEGQPCAAANSCADGLMCIG